MKRSRDDLHPSAPDISKYRRVAPKPEDYETADAYTVRQAVPPAAAFSVGLPPPPPPGRYDVRSSCSLPLRVTRSFARSLVRTPRAVRW